MTILFKIMNNQTNFLDLGENITGQDWVVGDIHGCYTLLEQTLYYAGFNKTIDRLICVGDLIDRGPDSIKFLEYLKYPWFYSCMGNHEDMAIMALNGGTATHWYANGGLWASEQKDKNQEMLNALIALPYMIELKVNNKKVAICHAEFPITEMTYDEIKDVLINSHNYPERGFNNIIMRMMWGRTRYSNNVHCPYVSGIDHMFHGHTILSKIRVKNNYSFIDQGAYTTNKLIVINICEYLNHLENPDNPRDGIYYDTIKLA
mgnify:CR=1 FL=1